MSIQSLIPTYICDIAPYQGGKPISEVAREHHLEESSIVKLASNENPLVFSNNSEALEVSSNFIVVPFPGSKKLTKTIPNTKEIKDAETNQAIAFPPTLPTIFMSPILAIPTTKVEKTKGAIIICTNRIKMVPNSFIFFEKDSIASGN